MKRKLKYVMLFALMAGLGACTEEPEEVVPEKQEEEDVVVVEEEASVSGFSPAYMIEGETTEIQIEGAHFSENATEVEVYLLNAAGDDVKLEVQSVSSTLISVTAANISVPGEYSLQVKNKEHEVSPADKFVVHGKLAVDPIVGSSLEDGSYTIEVGGYLLITGKNFSATEANNQVWLIDAAGTETAATMIVSKFDRVGFLVPENLPLGDYQMNIVTDIQELRLTGKLIVEEATPRIETVSPVSLFAGEEMLISGKFFSAVAGENIVVLKKDYMQVELSVTSATESEIVAVTWTGLEAGEYTLSVTKNGKTTYYNQEKIVIKASPTLPVINSLNKTGFNKGETILITGENLKKEGAVTNINFVPFYGGTTLVRSATPNAEGTELSYTIPTDFPSGSYEIIVEVDWEFSESYGDIIKIQ